MNLGELLKLARKIKGMTLRDLERESGINDVLISQMETGHVKNPSFKNVVRLCEVLNVPLDRATGWFVTHWRELPAPPVLTAQDGGDK